MQVVTNINLTVIYCEAKNVLGPLINKHKRQTLFNVIKVMIIFKAEISI